MTKHESQLTRLRKHLKAGKSITFLEALGRFGIGNLKGRIYDLKRDGMDIDKEWIVTTVTKKRVAKYFAK